eukprot:SAG31_NODE_36418_length_313_cov_1.200935_1_plen_59_part_10
MLPLLLLLLLPKQSSAAIDAHRVTELPGWEGPLPSRHWAGQIKITPDGHPSPKWMFYWF